MPKESICAKKISKHWAYFIKLSDFIKKIILKLSNFLFLWRDHINSEKFPMNPIISSKVYQKPQKIALKIARSTIGNLMKIIQTNRQLMNNFQRGGKIKKQGGCTRDEENFEIILSLYGRLTFL